MTFLEAITPAWRLRLTTSPCETSALAVRRLAIAALKNDVPMT